MTDRYSGFHVVLEEDLRDDDAQATIAAIRQIKGVMAVEPVTANYEDILAKNRVRLEIGDSILAMWEALRRS